MDNSLPLSLAASLAAIGVGLLLPGPAMVGAMLATAHGGRRRGLAHSAGIVTGSALWAIIATLTVVAAISIDPILFAAMLVAGGAYLLLLATCFVRPGKRRMIGSGPADNRSAARAYKSGLLLQAANPKAVLTWAAAIAISAGPRAPVLLPLLAAVAGVALEVSFYTALVWFMSRGGTMIAFGRRQRLFGAMAAAIFALSGLWLLHSAYLAATAAMTFSLKPGGTFFHEAVCHLKVRWGRF